MFIACGLNHQTASLSLRETVALSAQAQGAILQQILAHPDIHEAMILSTCNRTELYCEADPDIDIMSWFATVYQVDDALLAPAFYLYTDEKAIQHLLRVASGLDSMMLGEPQILGQLKQAYQQAVQAKAVHRTLRPLLQYVFNASKRIRTKSGVGQHPISIASAAVQLITQSFKKETALTILIIGSGETASLVGRYLYDQQRHQFMVASRTGTHAEGLAQTIGGRALPIHELALHLAAADVVISATACPLPFISAPMVTHALNQRQQAPMLFLDLAMPRDIEANVGDLPHVLLYNIDDLHHKTTDSLQERRMAAGIAETLIEEEMHHVTHWQRARVAKQLICDYRHHMQILAKQEAERSLQQLANGQCHTHVIEELTDRLVNKLTHAPTLGLRQVAVEGRHELLDLAHYLFQRNTTRHEKVT